MTKPQEPEQGGNRNEQRGQESSQAPKQLLEQTRALLARYPAPAKNKPPEGKSGHEA